MDWTRFRLNARELWPQYPAGEPRKSHSTGRERPAIDTGLTGTLTPNLQLPLLANKAGRKRRLMKGVPDFYGVWKFHLRRKNLSPKAAGVIGGERLNGGKSIVFQEYKQVV